MDTELYNKLNELISLIKNDKRYIELKDLENKLLNDKELIENINKYNENPFDIKKKKDLYENENYSKYKKLENEILFLILEINKRLNSLTDKRGCHHENN